MKLYAIAALITLFSTGEQVRKLGILYVPEPMFSIPLLTFSYTVFLSFSNFQACASETCTCLLKNSQKAFPHGDLSRIEDEASKCIGDVSPAKVLSFCRPIEEQRLPNVLLYPDALHVLSLQALHLQSLLLGLERRLPQLEDDMSLLEKEDDGDLYGVISLQLLENELLEIQQLLHRLNSTVLGQQRLSEDTAKQVRAAPQAPLKDHSPQFIKKQRRIIL